MRAQNGFIYGVLGAVLAVGALQLATVVPASAQESGPELPQGTSTVRAARLTFQQGTVTAETSSAPGTQPAQTNLPLLAGTRLFTGDDGEAEVEFEDGSVLRLTPNSTLSLDNLSIDPGGVFTTSATLLRGLAYAELRASSQYRYALSAGGQVLSPLENITVRITFDEPPARFAVLDGTAQIVPSAGGSPRQVHAGETLRAGDDSAGGYSIAPGITDETWDAWNSDRDAAEAAESADATAVRDGYAGAQGYGWADLDANGTWYDVPGQGQVWQPTAAFEDAGFDPYGLGAWVWYPSAGYVWASGYPWGWTPYRCGSWNFFNGFGWGWSPASGCGGSGWAFWGTGRPVNILYGPSGYRVPIVPRPHPGPVHPILPTRLEPARERLALAGQTGWGTVLQRSTRDIGGRIATPVQARQSDAALSAAPVHGPAALARDYPVDRNTHAPLTGRVSAQPGLVFTGSGWQRAPERSTTYTGQSGASIFRQRQGQADRSASGSSTAPTPPAASPAQSFDHRQSGTRAQSQPGQPARLPGQAPETAAPGSMQRAPYLPPAVQSQQPNQQERGQRPYAPPVQRPTYTPPVQQQNQRPSYNPPPQVQAPRYSPPPPQMHYSPPPPPPRAATPAPAGHSPK